MTATLLEPAAADDRLLPWPKVRDMTGISRTTAWRLQRAGDFPLPVVISPGRVGWRESELQTWRASRAPRTALPKPEKSFLPFGEHESTPMPAAPSLPNACPATGKTTPAPSKPAHPHARRRPPSDSGQITFDFG
ncbi:MAG: AlpA family phage regulatory protein [Caulobacteraceae bacterium]